MEMNNDIFTPDLPVPEPVGFEDAPIPAPAEDEKPAETPPKPPRGMRFTTPTAHGASFLHLWAASSRQTAARRLLLWTTTASASSSLSKK